MEGGFSRVHLNCLEVPTYPLQRINFRVHSNIEGALAVPEECMAHGSEGVVGEVVRPIRFHSHLPPRKLRHAVGEAVSRLLKASIDLLTWLRTERRATRGGQAPSQQFWGAKALGSPFRGTLPGHAVLHIHILHPRHRQKESNLDRLLDLPQQEGLPSVYTLGHVGSKPPQNKALTTTVA